MLDKAVEAVKIGGAILRKYWGRLPRREIATKGVRDFVSVVDRESERAITDYLASHFPSFSILGEEGGMKEGGDNIWIIDPLDGTTNFVNGVPYFSVCVALEMAGELVLGVVYDPLRNELFSAEKGKGAFLNGIPISVGNRKVDEFVVACGIPFSARDSFDAFLNVYRDAFFTFAAVRNFGAASLNIVYSACGRVGGFWEVGLSIWDTAAASVIVRCAGGVVTTFDGEENLRKSGNVIGGTEAVHRELSSIVKRHFGG